MTDIQETVSLFEKMSLQRQTQRFSYNPNLPKGDGPTKVIVTIGDTFVEALNVIGENPLILNMASWEYPGGSFLYGVGTQEESLCRRSTLYWHIKQERYPFLIGEALYSPSVQLLRDCGLKMLDQRPTLAIVTIPAVDMKTECNHLENMTIQLDTLFGCAKHYNHDTLVLGAWGCGVFRWSAEEMSKLFQTAIKKWQPKKVIFAMNNFETYQAFYKTFHQ